LEEVGNLLLASTIPIFVWMSALTISAFVIFSKVFLVVSLVDLESDFMNPTDMCRKTNQLVIPEYLAHGLLTFIFLITGNWLEFLINLPLIIFRIFRVRAGKHRLDPTKIFSVIAPEKKIAVSVLIFYMLCLFYYFDL